MNIGSILIISVCSILILIGVVELWWMYISKIRKKAGDLYNQIEHGDIFIRKKDARTIKAGQQIVDKTDPWNRYEYKVRDKHNGWVLMKKYVCKDEYHNIVHNTKWEPVYINIIELYTDYCRLDKNEE